MGLKKIDLILLACIVVGVAYGIKNKETGMSMIKWHPFAQLEKDLANDDQGLDLAVDMYEDNGNVVARMNVPGIEKKDIQVKIEGNELHISGKREEKEEVKNKNYYHKEIRYGSFDRMMTLPSAVDASRVTYDEKDGILTVVMPKK